jgi:hypothetical protein
MYYKWLKEFLEAGKQRLLGDTKRHADGRKVQSMKWENEQLKAMAGFQNIIVRGLGFQSALMPAAVLTLFAAGFLGLSVFLFKFE